MQGKRLALYAGLTSIVAAVVIALAGQVSFSGVSFSLGSLVANGELRFVKAEDFTITLTAGGVAETLCRNKSGKASPGQSPAQWTSSGSTKIPGSVDSAKNGKIPFGVPAPSPSGTLPWNEAGCPSQQWTAEYTGWVDWRSANLTATGVDGSSVSQSYACVTRKNPASVSCS